MREFAIYMINTDLVTVIEAAEWEIEDNTFLIFYDNQKNTISVFNMKNIAGFKEIMDDESE